YLVPLIFESYASDLAARVAEVKPRSVLEIAAGTGALTRALALRLPVEVLIAATDLNQPMLDYAARKLAGDGRITWRQADALALPFDNDRFDSVVCQFGVMFFPDKVQGYKQAYRVLNRGDPLSCTGGNQTAGTESAVVEPRAWVKFSPRAPPLFLARAPHGYHDVAKIREELLAAGFALISAE